MTAMSRLNLIGVVSPFCLLEFKAALSRMRPYQVLEVLIQDPEVMEDLIRLVSRSPDRIVCKELFGEAFRLRIERRGTEGSRNEEER